jgi:hypothetical protein
MAPELAPNSVLLPIGDIAQLFNPPRVNPLSSSLPEILGTSGAEYVLHRLQTRRQVKAEMLRLTLPKDQLASGLAEETQRALRRYAEYRIQEQQELARETRRHGWRLTGVAFLLLALFLAVSQLFASELTEWMRPLLRTTLEYGFEIIGWVMLWYPIEVLVFSPIAIRQRIEALRRLTALRVVIEPGDLSVQ